MSNIKNSYVCKWRCTYCPYIACVLQLIPHMHIILKGIQSNLQSKRFWQDAQFYGWKETGAMIYMWEDESQDRKKNDCLCEIVWGHRFSSRAVSLQLICYIRTIFRYLIKQILAFLYLLAKCSCWDHICRHCRHKTIHYYYNYSTLTIIRTLKFPILFYSICLYIFSWLIIITHLKEFNIVTFLLRRDKQSNLTVIQFFLLLYWDTFTTDIHGVAPNLLWVKLATTMKNFGNSSMVSFQDINPCHFVLECD